MEIVICCCDILLLKKQKRRDYSEMYNAIAVYLIRRSFLINCLIYDIRIYLTKFNAMTEMFGKKKYIPSSVRRQFHASRFSTRVHHQLRFLINAKNGSDGKKERSEVRGGGTFSQGEIPGNGSGSR